MDHPLFRQAFQASKRLYNGYISAILPTIFAGNTEPLKMFPENPETVPGQTLQWPYPNQRFPDHLLLTDTSEIGNPAVRRVVPDIFLNKTRAHRYFVREIQIHKPSTYSEMTK